MPSAALPPERGLGQALAVLPDPVCVDCGGLTLRGRRHVREHGPLHVYVVVGMRIPGDAAHLAAC